MITKWIIVTMHLIISNYGKVYIILKTYLIY